MDPDEIVEEPVEPTEPVASEPTVPVVDEATIRAMVADQIRAEFNARPAPAPVVQPANTQDDRDPWVIAEERAEREGRGLDQSYIGSLATQISTQRSEQKLLGMISPLLAPLYTKNAAEELVGQDQYAKEYAAKLIAKGMNVQDPDVQDMIKRASASYSQERAPARAQVTVEPTSSVTPVTPNPLRQEADELSLIAAKALGYDPRVLTLTDDELAEAI